MVINPPASLRAQLPPFSRGPNFKLSSLDDDEHRVLPQKNKKKSSLKTYTLLSINSLIIYSQFFLMIKNLPYYQLELPQIFEMLNTSQEGISATEVISRRQLYGENVLTDLHRESSFQKFLKQFKDALIILLIIATIISVYLQDYRGASILGTLLLVNALIGYFQEAKAEKIMQSLKKMLHPVTKVKRNGKLIEVKASELVPGDVVYLDE